MKSKLYNRSFILMGIINMFTVSSFGCFFLFPLFITEHGGLDADIGIIMGTFALASVLCRPWISEMIDRIGRKKSYVIGCFSMTLLSIAYLVLKGTLSDFYILLVIIRFLHGISLAICFTATFTYIADIVPKDRLNEGIGMFGVTGLTGLAVGPVIGEVIVKEFGFPYFFIAATCLAAIGLFLLIFLPESYVPVLKQSSVSFFSVLKKGRVFTVGLLALLFGVALAATGNFVTPFATQQGIGFISLYYIAYSSSAVITRLLGGKLADAIGEETIIPYATVITSVGILMLMFLDGDLVLLVSGLFSGCGHGFLFPCLNSLAIRDEPISIRGKITGVFTGAIDAGAFMGSVILGYIGEWFGSRVIFLMAGTTLLLSLVILRIRPFDKQQ